MKTNVQFCDNFSLILFRMRNVADKNNGKNQNTLLMFKNIFFSKIVPFLT